ncbi:MAG: ABC transporter ATP-binding protein [Actinomycetota bacterium]|nr:ABC transporter ATP-binding protein [Actinomycetota bacterium]
MTAALQTAGLGRRYSGGWALRECSVRIANGQVAGLVGANGAGKTTLLLLAMGLLEPTAGEVRVLGLSPLGQQQRLLPRVGFVAQDHPLYPGFRVRELLELGRRLNGDRFDTTVALHRLRDADIPLGRRAGKLSGGQQAQVALALALAKRPELLILDEPVASLDPLARRAFLQVLMEAVATDGMAVLLSSHLVSDLERVCDELIVLAHGRVQLAGPIGHLQAEHHLLTGPSAGANLIARAVPVIQAHHTGRQSTLLIRGDVQLLDPAWRHQPIGLEEIVLAYMHQQPALARPAEPSEQPQ